MYISVMATRFYVILSDIHANFEALVSVVADIRSLPRVDEIVSLGDVVGYGPQPEECVNLVRELGMHSLMGNHEQGLINIHYVQRFNQPARDALRFTREHLSEESYQWLVSRPKSLVLDNMRFVHGMPPDSVSTYLWSFNNRLADAFDLFAEPICFVGHTHETGLYEQGAEARKLPFPDAATLLPDVRYLVNVGAVGQPRGNDSRAAYCLYDAKSRTLEVRRVEYDIDKTADLIRHAGLHRAFADRLYRN